MVDSRQLQHALILAEHGSFARAAHACHITQPALTRSIQTLERALGARLFDRSTRHVELTELGRITLAHAQTVALAMRDLKRDIELSKGLELGELGIGATMYAGAVLISPVIGQLNLAHPRLKLNLVVSPWKELPSRLRSREVELVVGEVHDLAAHDDIVCTPLEAHRMYFVFRQGHALAQHRALTFAQVFAYPTAGPTQPEHFRTAILAALPDSLREEVRRHGYPTITCESLTALESILQHSDAVALMTPYMVVEALRSGQLVAVAPLDLPITLRMGVARVRGRTSSAPAKMFEELLIAHDKILHTTQIAAQRSNRFESTRQAAKTAKSRTA
jgi:DNA-binding transcriptional LysR family regulator